MFKFFQRGGLLLKFGRSGKPHYRHFSLNESKTKLKWVSQKKQKDQTVIRVRDMSVLFVGQKSEVFTNSKFADPQKDAVSFSIYYHAPETERQKKVADCDDDKEVLPLRSLDIVCKDEEEFNIWAEGLRWLIANKNSLVDVGFESKCYVESLQMLYVGPSFSSPAQTISLLPSYLHVFIHHKYLDEEEEVLDALGESIDLYTWGANSWGQLGLTAQIDDLVYILLFA